MGTITCYSSVVFTEGMVYPTGTLTLYSGVFEPSLQLSDFSGFDAFAFSCSLIIDPKIIFSDARSTAFFHIDSVVLCFNGQDYYFTQTGNRWYVRGVVQYPFDLTTPNINLSNTFSIRVNGYCTYNLAPSSTMQMVCNFNSSSLGLYAYHSQSSTDLDKVYDELEKGNGLQEEENETTKGIWQTLIDFFTGFFSNLINAVISLFIPSTEDMSDLFDQLNDFFSDRFGFLYAPFDYMIRLMQVFTSSTGSTGLTLPGFSIMGYVVWSDQTYDLASDPLVNTICGYVRMGTGILLSGYFIMYLQQFFKERFGTG